ncbi:MAG: hypothetical protein ACR2JK_11855 [Geodermatophilaceae bacterium]
MGSVVVDVVDVVQVVDVVDVVHVVLVVVSFAPPGLREVGGWSCRPRRAGGRRG